MISSLLDVRVEGTQVVVAREDGGFFTMRAQKGNAYFCDADCAAGVDDVEMEQKVLIKLLDE